MSHYVDCDLLIIKLMPSVKYEMAFANLSREFDRKLWGMGLPVSSLLGVGAGRFSGSLRRLMQHSNLPLERKKVIGQPSFSSPGSLNHLLV